MISKYYFDPFFFHFNLYFKVRVISYIIRLDYLWTPFYVYWINLDPRGQTKALVDHFKDVCLENFLFSTAIVVSSQLTC